jgi:glycosyltransferase involved in cell wall biosynthesis
VITTDFEDRAAEPVNHPWLKHSSPPVYLSAGRLAVEKDHATLLRAFALYCQDGRPGRLMILGEGPLRAELQVLSNALGISERVTMPGFVPNPLPYIRRAAAFVLTSRAEGFGNVLVEALGVGTPVISTDCPYGPAEILDHGRYGLLVPCEDPVSLAAAISPHLRNVWPSDLLKRRGHAFSAGQSATSYLALMRKLVGRRRLAGGEAAQP